MSDVIEISIDIAASPATVFTFLTQPEGFAQWMGANSGLGGLGGRDFEVHYPNGDVAVGTILESEAPRRVVYSWGYRGGAYGLEPGASRVEFDLVPTDTGTRVTLRHAGLPTDALRQSHLQGWTFYSGLLAARAAAQETANAVPHALEAWLQAWNAGDVDALSTACSETVVYADQFAVVSGRDALARYISNARRFQPGAELSVVGQPAITQRFARFSWRIDGGHAAQTGEIFVDVTPAGKFGRVVSFWS